jgi:sugar phosphate isomerase/epimerase
MTPFVTRRTFAKALLAAGGAATLPTFVFAQGKKLKIGCTTLIWGGLPRTPEYLDTTVKVTDPAARREQIEMLQRCARPVKKYGGRFLVQSCNNRGENYNFAANRANIIAALNDYGKAVTDIGIGTGLHQHTGSAIETREETYTVVQTMDTRVMKFAPDIGQAQKGGTDTAKLVKDFASIIPHMHFKDYKGWDQMAGYSGSRDRGPEVGPRDDGEGQSDGEHHARARRI